MIVPIQTYKCPRCENTTMVESANQFAYYCRKCFYATDKRPEKQETITILQSELDRLLKEIWELKEYNKNLVSICHNLLERIPPKI